jgi:hypothetical protein
MRKTMLGNPEETAHLGQLSIDGLLLIKEQRRDIAKHSVPKDGACTHLEHCGLPLAQHGFHFARMIKSMRIRWAGHV